ncbi:AAA family ATPase [Bradyrhizobium sp. 62B]|uniref:AAA family ATPase n=1 Tax=Bradyrhizobium sp. 62B TaxID=2898442 RepID=UPI002557E12E|nr:AAA family ATPase [Bradyrhizobium sp. 62B]
MRFQSLSLNGWRQFQDVHIDFHPRLTVITGANGAGKSTLLRLISDHYGWSYPLLATPAYSKAGILSYLPGIFSWWTQPELPPRSQVGGFKYSDGTASSIYVPNDVNAITYNVSIEHRPHVLGLHVPSHRPSAQYQQVASIPTNAIGAQQAFDIYRNETFQRFQNSYTQFSPTYRMKEAIISMATFGPGNQYVQRNSTIAELFDGFKGVLKKMLPPSIGFKDINVRIPDVVIVTETGDFILDAASGGLLSLFDLAWQIYLYAHDKSEFVVTIDEPENHLHPSMQRALMGRLLEAFPNAQFIIATHSPFMVSSVRDSFVYVLGYNPNDVVNESGINSRVSSLKLDAANKAGTASEILRDVLGVPVTLPEWAESDLRQIASEFKIQMLTSDEIARLRQRLDDAGLGEYYPDALRQIAGAA